MTARLLLTLTAYCGATLFSMHAVADTSEKLETAIADDARDTVDMARDANRKPRHAREFVGLKDDMKVLEL